MSPIGLWQGACGAFEMFALTPWSASGGSAVIGQQLEPSQSKLHSIQQFTFVCIQRAQRETGMRLILVACDT